MCIFAIGMGQLIGRCVGRDKRTGRFVSLTKHLVIGAYTDSEPVELERRPNGLSAVTEATRWAAREASVSGYITQVWTWRNGEAVVLNRCSSSWPGDWAVVIRRGLRRGTPRLVPAGSMSMALASLGITYRIKSARQRPVPVDPSTREGRGARAQRRQTLKRAARRKGNQWRTLRAKPPCGSCNTPLNEAMPVSV